MNHSITIAADHAEAEQYCQWLNDNGHNASIGNSTATIIDGETIGFGASEETEALSERLWNQYCNS